MGPRVDIAVTALASAIISAVISVFSYGGSFLARILFALVFPFAGTYPLPLDYINHTDRMADYWPFAVGTWMVGLGIYGWVTRNQRFASVFVIILVLSWALTISRLFVFDAGR